MSTIFLGFAGKLTALNILGFIKQTETAKTVGWLTGKALEQIFEDGKQSEIIEKLKDIDKTFGDLKLTLHDKVDMQWMQWHSTIYDAEKSICHLFRIVQSVMSITDSSERNHQMKRLTVAILDIHLGVLSKMSDVHTVLVGKTTTNPLNEGLLLMWTKGMNNSLLNHPMSADAYRKCVMDYLNSVAILQYMGFLLFWGSCDSLEYGMMQISSMKGNIESEITIIENLMPAAMKYLLNPDEQKSFLLRPVSDAEVFDFPNTLDRMLGLPTKLRHQRWSFEKTVEGSFGAPCYIKRYDKYMYNDSRKGYLNFCGNFDLSFGENKHNAGAFYVMPMITSDKSMKIVICTTNELNKRFLGYNQKTGLVEAVDKRGNIEFDMTLDN